MAIGDWNVGGPSSGATGDLKRVRQAWEALELAANPDIDISWMETGDLAAPIARMAEAFLAASKEVGPNWSLASRSDGGGLDYLGGFYLFKSGEWTTAAPEDLGSANNPTGAKALVVMGSPHVDDNMVIRATGTSVTDAGVRTPADFELIDTAGAVLNQYFETEKTWVGTVRFTLDSGTGSSVNVGLCKYYNHNDNSFLFDGFDIVGRATKTDNDVDLQFIHHRPTGWTFSVGSEPSPPVLLSMVSAYGSESDYSSGRHFAWKRAGLNKTVDGANGEGIILRITTSLASTIQHLNCDVRLG